jgi:lipoprotein signal peptidase
LPDRITYRKFVDYVQTAIMQSVFKLADVRYSKTEVLLRV